MDLARIFVAVAAVMFVVAGVASYHNGHLFLAGLAAVLAVTCAVIFAALTRTGRTR